MGSASQGAGGEWVGTHQRGHESQHPESTASLIGTVPRDRSRGVLSSGGQCTSGREQGQRLRGGNRPGECQAQGGGLSVTLVIREVGTEQVGHRGWGKMRPRGSQEAPGVAACPLSTPAQGRAILEAGG